MSAASDSARTAGSVTSTPPGACGLAVAVPTTSTGVSSGGSPAAASPRTHDLGEAGAVADDQERERGELAAAVHPALQPDGRRRASACGQVADRVCVGHGYLQWTEALEVWAGARSRCHHTFAEWCRRPLVGTPDARTPLLAAWSGGGASRPTAVRPIVRPTPPPHPNPTLEAPGHRVETG